MTSADVERLHKLFVTLTGRDIPLDIQGVRAHQWFDWAKQGFTGDDLRLVVAHIRKGIREGRRNEGALKFVNMIGDPLRFGEDLAEAKALARVPKADHGRESVLRATGRPTTNNEPKITPAGKLAFEAFKEFGQKLERELNESQNMASGDGQ